MGFLCARCNKWPGAEHGVLSGAHHLRSSAENPKERDQSDQMSGKYDLGGKIERTRLV